MNALNDDANAVALSVTVYSKLKLHLQCLKIVFHYKIFVHR